MTYEEKRKIISKILNWIQILLGYYYGGEDNLPKGLSPILTRYKSKIITTGPESFICDRLGLTDNIEDIYLISISAYDAFHSVFQNIPINDYSTSLVVVNSDLDLTDRSVYRFNNKFIILLPKSILKVEDMDKSVYYFNKLSHKLVDLIYCEPSDNTTDSELSFIRNSLISTIFVKFCFVGKSIINFNSMDFAIEKYYDCNEDITKTSLQEHLLQTLEKFDSGDFNSTVWDFINNEIINKRSTGSC